MKNLLIASLLTVSLTSASYADSFFDYLGFGVALQDVTSPNFDQGVALVVHGGKSFYQGVGIEFEGTTSIQKMEASFNGMHDDIDFWSLAMYSTYIWKLGNLSVKPRLGLVYDSIKSDIDINSPKTAEPGVNYLPTDKSGVGLSAGIGLAYQLGESYNVYTNYTRMEDDIDHLTFGAEFKF